MTSLRRIADLLYLKKEGVVTYMALALPNCALAQSLLAVLTRCKANDGLGFTDQFFHESCLGSQISIPLGGKKKKKKLQLPAPHLALLIYSSVEGGIF